MSDPTVRLFRRVVLAFTFILASLAIWLTTAEFFRSPSTHLSENAQATKVAAANQNAAALAAEFGVIRGDLWAEYALTYSDFLLEHEPANTQPKEVIERAREITVRALDLAPYNARLWLLLSTIDARFDWLNSKSSIELRMSYYTGANEAELIQARLLLAFNTSEIEDRDFQQLVQHDILIIVTRKPELIPAIVAAYRDTSPIGQQFLEATLRDLDPTLLANLQSKK